MTVFTCQNTTCTQQMFRIADILSFVRRPRYVVFELLRSIFDVSVLVQENKHCMFANSSLAAVNLLKNKTYTRLIILFLCVVCIDKPLHFQEFKKVDT